MTERKDSIWHRLALSLGIILPFCITGMICIRLDAFMTGIVIGLYVSMTLLTIQHLTFAAPPKSERIVLLGGAWWPITIVCATILWDIKMLRSFYLWLRYGSK